MNKKVVTVLILTLTVAFAVTSSVAELRAMPPPPEPDHQKLDPLSFRGPMTLAPDNPNTQSAGIPEMAAWSKLVFQSLRDDNWEIYLANGDGSNQTRLTYDGATDAYPRLNRGCTRIAFASRRTGNYEIFSMKPDGTDVVQLTSAEANDYNPFWSPDGVKIAFSSYRDGQSEIYVMNADGSNPTRLTWNEAYDGEPAWSPDGAKIAFTSNRSGAYHIWGMNSDGSQPTQLSDRPYNGEHPAWSPDGKWIAYDADTYNNGWQDIWLMNADGSDEQYMYASRRLYTDSWVRSWSPDGHYVAITTISFIYHEGYLYWTSAFLDAWQVGAWDTTVRLSSQGTDWYPDWQTCDIDAPASSVHTLPSQSPGPIPVRWSSTEMGSGLQDYDVQVKEGSGAWTGWLTSTLEIQSLYPGIGGRTYYFRSRARDKAGNVEPWPADYDAFTTVEAQAPSSVIEPLPAYSHNEPAIRWGGKDLGGSGIKTFDVQYQDVANGAWNDWQVGVAVTNATFTGTLGRTYAFRSRATDNAQNVEPWPAGGGDASTTLYKWGISGVMRDNAGAPVSGGTITTTPGALAAFPSDPQGAYQAYVAYDTSIYQVAWGKNGYGLPPVTSFDAAQDAHLDVVLPPIDDVVKDGGFEDGRLGSDWISRDEVAPIVTSTTRYMGNLAVLFGRPFAFESPVNVTCLPGWPQLQQLVLDRRGTPHLLWQEWTVGDYTLYYTQREDDGNWLSPQSLTSSPDPGQSNAWMGVDALGIVHVLWQDYTEGQSQVFYAQRNSAGSWSSPYNVSNMPDGAALRSAAIDDNNVLHVIFVEHADIQTAAILHYVRRQSGGTWSTSQAISGGTGYAGSSQVQADASGTAHVIWVAADYKLYYVQCQGNACSSPYMFASNPIFTVLQMTVTPNGRVHMTWDDWDHVRYIERDSNGHWSPVKTLSAGIGGYWPQIGMSEDGQIHVVWFRRYGATCHAWKQAQGSWSSPQCVAQPSYGFQDGMATAVDRQGNVHLVWSYRTSYFNPEWSWDVYYVQWRQHTGAWTAPRLLDIVDTPNGIAAQLAVDDKGHVNMIRTGIGPWGDPDIFYLRSLSAEQSSDVTIAQAVTIPMTMSTPVLSFLYQFGSTSLAGGNWFRASVNDGITATTLVSINAVTDDWTHRWFDLSSWRGQVLTVAFDVRHVGGFPTAWAYLDEVTLGSANPDLWVSKSSPPAAKPGEQVVYTISYGNQGGAPASGMRFTDTLPAELDVVGANPSPVVSGSLLLDWGWDVRDLPAQSGPFVIVITANVSATIPMFSNLTNTVRIQSTSGELETANNVASALTFIGYRVYLPLVARH
ncbi:MAG: PD40 domain-containing protein [Thermoflexales bacterium]|nr:PD40 domain-containing protein [Thermoflexales bacterium]